VHFHPNEPFGVRFEQFFYLRKVIFFVAIFAIFFHIKDFLELAKRVGEFFHSDVRPIMLVCSDATLLLFVGFRCQPHVIGGLILCALRSLDSDHGFAIADLAIKHHNEERCCRVDILRG
jgi:hypothetical protein